MIPDVEAIVTPYLKAATKARVVGQTPNGTSASWVRVTQLDAPSVGDSRTERLIEWMGQFDCYAGRDGGQGEASELTRTIRAALVAMPGAALEGATVTGVRIVSCPRIPDTDLEPARERYALTAVLFVHP